MPHDPPHDPPDDDVLDEPLIGVKLNQHWMSHVIGLASVTADQDYWASDQERGEEQAIELLDILAKGNTPVFDPLSARVRRTTNQLIPHNVFTKVVFDTVVYDPHGLWSPATPNRVSLPEIGSWLVGGHVLWALNAVGQRWIAAEGSLSGSVSANEDTGSPNQLDMPVIGFVNVTTPEFVSLRVWQTSGISLNIRPRSVRAIDLWVRYLGPI